jgi:hypothetical protein
MEKALLSQSSQPAIVQQRLESRWVDVLELVFECRHRQCKEPRDRIYGYVGMRSALIRQLPILDYSFPYYKVFEDFQLEVIRRSQSLDILSSLGPWNVERAHSWLVDWGISLLNVDRLPIRAWHEHIPRFCASEDTTSIVEFIHPYALSVRGFQVGHVTRTGSFHVAYFEDDATWRK